MFLSFPSISSSYMRNNCEISIHPSAKHFVYQSILQNISNRLTSTSLLLFKAKPPHTNLTLPPFHITLSAITDSSVQPFLITKHLEGDAECIYLRGRKFNKARQTAADTVSMSNHQNYSNKLDKGRETNLVFANASKPLISIQFPWHSSGCYWQLLYCDMPGQSKQFCMRFTCQLIHFGRNGFLFI